VRVILVSASSDAVGVATHTLDLARLLASASMLDCVVCPTEGWLSDQLRASSLPVDVLDVSYQPAQFITANIRFLRLLRRRANVDVVHLHGRFPLFIALLAMLLERRKNFVSTVHQFASSGTHGFLSWKLRLETAVLRSLSNVCCVSHALGAEVVERLGRRSGTRVDVIPNWITRCYSDVCEVSSVNRRAIRVCAIGRLVEEKGFDVLIQAISFLRTQGERVQCDIFGAGPAERTLLHQIDQHNVHDCVQLRGQDPEVRERLRSYDVLVVPSHRESFGLVVLEAYDAGVPVVASDIPGLREIVVDGETGLLFPAGDPVTLAYRLCAITTLHELRAKLIMNGQEFLRPYTAGAEILGRYVQFYTQSASC
jgi:glycosyltransferase involved in cell wall biosynthesis